MRPTSALGAVTLLVFATAGCGDAAPRPERRDDGTLIFALAGADGIEGFQFDVSGPTGPLASRFIATGDSASAFFTLPPGDYRVTGTPMDGPGVPAAHCTPSTATAHITKGQTTAIMLVARCQSRSTGGLDGRARVDHEPEITGIAFDPATSAAPCAPLSLAVTATDADGDPLTYRFVVTSAPSPPASFTLDIQGNRATFVGTAAGVYELAIQACDPGGCVDFRAVLHVEGEAAGGGACVVSCDDANPCTVDTRAPDGICGHEPVQSGTLCTNGNLHVKLLGINDFHGQLDAGRRVGSRPVGGASVLVSYLRAAQRGIEDQTFIVHAGDLVGASPPDSALLEDEPSIQVMNLLANPSCAYMDKMNPACNMVGTLGNHEFDEGRGELLRLLGGGNFAGGPFLEDPYRGARFPYVSANVAVEATGDPLIAPLVVKQSHGVPLAFIGAVLKGTPTIVTPSGVAGLRFLDEADAINSYVPGLKAMGVRAIVVTIHQGGFQTSYTGPTNAAAAPPTGPEILDIVNRLDDEIDVVISGHTHAFTNALIPNEHGKPILVTQAFSGSTAYDDIDVLIDPVSRDVVAKTAQVVTTFGDVGPGLTPAADAQAIADAAFTRVAPLVTQVFGLANTPFTRAENAAGESTLGDLIADAQREATDSQLAFMNPGGIRSDLDAGDITYNDLFTIQPFGNTLVTMNLTGAQIYQVLEQQFSGAFGQTVQRLMKTSGFHYTWDSTSPAGSRIVEVDIDGVPIDLHATYSVTCNNFMAGGGDGFTTFLSGTNQRGGSIDLDVLIQYVKDHTSFTAGRLERVTRR